MYFSPPQPTWLVTRPLTSRFPLMVISVGSMLPFTLPVAFTNSVPAGPSGKVKRARPVRGVAVRATVTPESSRTWYRPGCAVSFACENVTLYGYASPAGDAPISPTTGMNGTS